MPFEVLAEYRCHGGVQGFYRHRSTETGGPMKFGLFRPAQISAGKFPLLTFLAGLTCSEETAAIKAGAQRLAAELGLALLTPDTSPRDTGIEGATGDWEFGEGAGFYLDATAAPYSERFRMDAWVTRELPALIATNFNVDIERSGLCGHSMGGHGALTLALRNPGMYRSLSAFAPIVAPCQVPWGQKALARFLGDDREAWRRHDSVELIRSGHRFDGSILVDQGDADAFLEAQLRPELLRQACAESGQPLDLRLQPGYDHSYWFIQSFIADHLQHHARALHLE
ncbi:MAG: S-formylglutathione hydrolase [Dokdonella sp.]|nr:S-formylglutathione hydrolase [Dokdonella sp.]MCB1576396.1 S-formylglutathione hydrolase [Xanthomonadales bacterium]